MVGRCDILLCCNHLLPACLWPGGPVVPAGHLATTDCSTSLLYNHHCSALAGQLTCTHACSPADGRLSGAAEHHLCLHSTALTAQPRVLTGSDRERCFICFMPCMRLQGAMHPSLAKVVQFSSHLRTSHSEHDDEFRARSVPCKTLSETACLHFITKWSGGWGKAVAHWRVAGLDDSGRHRPHSHWGLLPHRTGCT